MLYNPTRGHGDSETTTCRTRRDVPTAVAVPGAATMRRDVETSPIVRAGHAAVRVARHNAPPAARDFETSVARTTLPRPWARAFTVRRFHRTGSVQCRLGTRPLYGVRTIAARTSSMVRYWYNAVRTSCTHTRQIRRTSVRRRVIVYGNNNNNNTVKLARDAFLRDVMNGKASCARRIQKQYTLVVCK